MSDLKPGDLVVCVDAPPRMQGPNWDSGRLVAPTDWAVYTVREVIPDYVFGATVADVVVAPGLRLAEIVNPVLPWKNGTTSEAAWSIHRFRPVSRKSTELFRSLVENPKLPVRDFHKAEG